MSAQQQRLSEQFGSECVMLFKSCYASCTETICGSNSSGNVPTPSEEKQIRACTDNCFDTAFEEVLERQRSLESVGPGFEELSSHASSNPNALGHGNTTGRELGRNMMSEQGSTFRSEETLPNMNRRRTEDASASEIQRTSSDGSAIEIPLGKWNAKIVLLEND